MIKVAKINSIGKLWKESLNSDAGTEINFYVHKQIIACYQNCYKQIVWIL